MTVHPIDTEALRKLADAATEGPWYTFETKLGRRNGIGSRAIPEDEAVMEDEWSGEADAEFIAAAREAIPALLDALDQAEADRDWLFRSSRLSKMERIKANARAERAEARVRHLEDTARVLVKDMLAATDARDEHRRGKAAAEAQVSEEKRLRMKATEAATKAEAERDAARRQYDEDTAYWIAATDTAEAQIKAVRDVLDNIDTSNDPALHDGFADIRRALYGDA